jgi:hypothetical protein
MGALLLAVLVVGCGHDQTPRLQTAPTEDPRSSTTPPTTLDKPPAAPPGIHYISVGTEWAQGDGSFFIKLDVRSRG